MKNNKYYSFLNTKVKVYTDNFKKISKIKGKYYIRSYDYNTENLLWQKYDDFIKKTSLNVKVKKELLEKLQNLKSKRVYNKDEIKKINTSYIEIIKFIESNSAFIFDLDFILQFALKNE